MKTGILALIGISILAACSAETVSKVSSSTTSQAPLPEVGNVKASVIPEWCNNLPENTIFSIYACGTAKSDTLSMARTRAQLDAKRQLADILQNQISTSLTEQMTEDSTSTEQETESYSKDLTIRGYQRLKEETISVENGYQHFILIEMDIGVSSMDLNKELDKTVNQSE
jgi:hypothetical protein